MKKKLILLSSSIFLGVAGSCLSFLPNEILNYVSIDTNQILMILLQILGELYLGFGLMNWMAKGSLIGGIYNRPIAIGNFMHFSVGAIALIKIVLKVQEHMDILMTLTLIYIIFAIGFAYVFMTNPSNLGDEK